MEEIKLIFPSGFYYQCESCGKCCRRNWQIPVETTQKAEALIQFADSNGISEKPLIDDPISKNRILNLRGGRGCVFLDEKNLCRVHASLSPEAKPLMCQTFPFKPVEFTDGRYYVRFSFACPSVRKNSPSNPSVETFEDIIKGYIRQGVVTGALKDFPVWLAMPPSENSSPLVMDENALNYLNEKVIFPLIDTDGISEKFFNKMWNFLFEVGRLASEKSENLISKETINECYDRMKQQTAGLEKKVSLKQLKSKRNLYYAIFAGYEFVGREESSPTVKLFNLFNLVRGRGILRTKYGKIDLARALKEVRYNENEDAASKELLNRYFRHIIESNWMLIKPSDGLWLPTVVNSWALLALFYGLIIRFAKIFAHLEGRSEVKFGDIDRALDVVEIEYVSHISRSWLFLNRRVFAKIFLSLAENPDFVSVILSDEE